MALKRNPKIEWLRIMSMFMVLMLHSIGHGGGCILMSMVLLDIIFSG